MKRIVLFMAVFAALAGCAGQPSVYYTLTPSVDSGPATASALAPVGPYSIGSVAVPAPVDDVLIVVRRSDDQLMKLAHDRWTAPLSKQVSNALAVALTSELGMPPLSKSQASTIGSGVTTISVDVQRFDLVPGEYAELTAAWQVLPDSLGANKAGLVCYTELRQSVEPGVAPLVKAQQANIERLAQAISAGWRTGKSGPATRCQ